MKNNNNDNSEFERIRKQIEQEHAELKERLQNTTYEYRVYALSEFLKGNVYRLHDAILNEKYFKILEELKIEVLK